MKASATSNAITIHNLYAYYTYYACIQKNILHNTTYILYIIREDIETFGPVKTASRFTSYQIKPPQPLSAARPHLGMKLSARSQVLATRSATRPSTIRSVMSRIEPAVDTTGSASSISCLMTGEARGAGDGVTCEGDAGGGICDYLRTYDCP